MTSSTADAAPTAPDGGPDPFADLGDQSGAPKSGAAGDDVDTDASDHTADDSDGADDIGDRGKQALDRMKERLAKARAEIAVLREQVGDPRGEEALADISKNAEERVRAQAEREAIAKANLRILRSEIKAAATGKLADAADALVFLDLTDFEVDDDGEVDEDEIADAITDLIAKKPHLAAQGGTKAPKPDRSQGARGSGAASTAQQFADAIPL